jgi:hypothetical protein
MRPDSTSAQPQHEPLRPLLDLFVLLIISARACLWAVIVVGYSSGALQVGDGKVLNDYLGESV